MILEEKLHLRKSKPVLLAAGLIWILIAAFYSSQGMPHAAEIAIRHNFLEYAEFDPANYTIKTVFILILV